MAGGLQVGVEGTWGAPGRRPPLWRDLWAWLSALAVVPLLVHAWGAPLGQPFMDDFDYLHRALFRGQGSYLDGFGSALYWRPLARQVYFGLFSPAMLSHPWIIAALHALLLAISAVLLYRVLRLHWIGPLAAAGASFVPLAEATRMLLGWGSGFQDLGALCFAILALHEAAHGRMPTALAALLGSLLSKEVGVLAALALPWLPAGGDRRRRVMWLAGVGAVLLVWGALYLAARHFGGVLLYREVRLDPGGVTPAALVRLGWAWGHSLLSAFNLPAPSAPQNLLAGGALVALGILAAWRAREAAVRTRLRAALPWAVWGTAWFLAASAPMIEVFPDWSPYRSLFASLGLGIALVAVLGAIHPGLVAALVALRLAAFAMSPGPASVTSDAPGPVGVSWGFPEQVRLQRLVTGTRSLLRARHPRLPPGAVIGQLHRPRRAAHAFAGDRSLQIWYRDTTLRWLDWERMDERSEAALVTIVDFRGAGAGAPALVRPEAMRHYLMGGALKAREAWPQALAELAAAEAAQDDRDARGFLGMIAGRRALCELGRDDLAAAERAARQGLAFLPENGDARYALVEALAGSGRLPEARAHADTLLSLYPHDAAVRGLAARLGYSF